MIFIGGYGIYLLRCRWFAGGKAIGECGSGYTRQLQRGEVAYRLKPAMSPLK